MRKSTTRILTAALFAFVATGAWAQVATVDGVGGAATGDALYPNSYATINAALVDVRINETVAGSTIQLTAPTITESAGVNLNLNNDVTVESTLPAGTNVQCNGSGIGIGAAAVAIVANIAEGKAVSLKKLIITPVVGAAGPVVSRVLQVYNRNAPAAVANYTFNMENCYITALTVPGNAPVLNPFVHAASADTIVARNSSLRAFDGGGGNNCVDFRFGSGGAEANSRLTANLKNTVITHTILAAAASKGGGIANSKTQGFTLNVNEGCVFSFNSGSGIRAVGTLAANTAINVNGTATNPVFFYKNGWMEDTVNTGRNEGIQNAGAPLTINHAYFVGNFQEHVDQTVGGNVTISNSYFAEAQTDLDTSNGTAPNVLNAANVKLSGQGIYSMTNCTVFNNKATANDQAIVWTAPAIGNSLTLTNVICAGTGDQLNLGAANAVIYNESNVALVQAGPDTLESPFITLGAGVTANVTDRITGDPQFVSTTFAPTFVSLGVKPTGLTNYLNVGSPAYLAARGGIAPIDVSGANPTSYFPVTLSGFAID
ncbi:hypothetical protein CVU37_15055 [candidate division BRC1 bacterium HGW-BRC1-1]|nr:MAG: hypothetical protein CVU37_15055 [candidate division BRC1 bacterium HGW-BRC1-1]